MARAALIVLLLATAGLYTPVLWHGYVYEDQRMFVSSTTWRVPSRALTLTSFPDGLPNPMRDHAVNVGVHLVTGLALAGAVVTMGGTLTAGVLAAGVLWVHPTASAAVSILSGRGDLFLALGLLLTLLATCQAVRGGGWASVGWWGLTGLAVLGTMWTKEWGLVAAPLVAWVVWREGRWPRWAAAAGMGALVGLAVWFLPLLAAWATMGRESGGYPTGYAGHLWDQVGMIGRYAGLVVWPFGQSLDHDALTLGLGWRLAGMGALGGLAIAAWRGSWAAVWIGLLLLPRLLVPTANTLTELQWYPVLVGVAALLAHGLSGLSGAAAWTFRNIRSTSR